MADNKLCGVTYPGSGTYTIVGVTYPGSGTYTIVGITKLCEALKGSAVTSLKCAAAQ